MKRSFLFGRKRTKELSRDAAAEVQSKKDQLLALKLQSMNDDAKASGRLLDLPIELIQSDPSQPRKRFRYLEGLSASIKEKGIIQPIIVSRHPDQKQYTVIAGERRLRAAKLAALSTIPCIIREENNATDTVVLQLLENDQRDGVSPMEESNALLRLIDEMGLTKSQLAKELGRDPSWVSIRLSLQSASEKIKALICDGVVEDARTLHELRKLDIENPTAADELIDKIRNNQLSGSYRNLITAARKRRRTKCPSGKTVHKIEQFGNQLLLYIVGSKHPLQFTLEDEVKQSLLGRNDAAKDTPDDATEATALEMTPELTKDTLNDTAHNQHDDAQSTFLAQ